MSEQRCRAEEATANNGHFVLLCDCPRCAASPVPEDQAPRNWLRVSGRTQRLRVEAIDLGPHGQALLG
ncbi:MAG: hypothetical protein ACKV2O_25085 [Acidimicrobiales bacterium]